MSRFSQLYIDQSTPLPDSARARYRLGKLLEIVITSDLGVYELAQLIERELGVKADVYRRSHWISFTKTCAIRDLLDTVTITHAFLKEMRNDQHWLKETRRIFAEERLAYEIDDGGLVHPAVDKEFQKNRQAAVAGLQLPRYANSLSAFMRISDELSSQPPNGKDAWRAIFGANEGLFRLMFPSANQLNAGAVETSLSPIIKNLYASDAVALRAANKQLASFKDWVDASHNYRHEPGSQEPVQPPLDLAVLAISNGTSFLRWLIALDQAAIKQP